jgi:hypothetical protein
MKLKNVKTVKLCSRINRNKRIKSNKLFLYLVIIFLVATLVLGGALACKNENSNAIETEQITEEKEDIKNKSLDNTEKLIEEQVVFEVKPKKAGEVEYENFVAPEFNNEIPIEQFLKKDPVWYMVGLAENSQKADLLDEDDADFKLEDFKRMAYTVAFYEDGTLKIFGDISGAEIEEEGKYEIIDVSYCDQTPDEEGSGFRFYLGIDDLIYACYYYSEAFINVEITDFIVLAPID